MSPVRICLTDTNSHRLFVSVYQLMYKDLGIFNSDQLILYDREFLDKEFEDRHEVKLIWDSRHREVIGLEFPNKEIYTMYMLRLPNYNAKGKHRI